MGQITVFSGPERRRRWSDDELLQILAEEFSPGACVAEVCRRHAVSTALIYTWRRKLREASAEPMLDTVPGSGFVEAVMVADGGSVHPGMRSNRHTDVYMSSSPSEACQPSSALSLSGLA